MSNEIENESPREDNKKRTGSEATDAKRLVGRSWNVASIGLNWGFARSPSAHLVIASLLQVDCLGGVLKWFRLVD